MSNKRPRQRKCARCGVEFLTVALTGVAVCPECRICTVPGCGGRIKARRLCNAHYERWERHGSPTGLTCWVCGRRFEGPLWVGGTGPTACPECGVCRIVEEGCARHARPRSGLCDKHYQRYKAYGDPYWTDPPRERGRCQMEGCSSPHLSRGLCGTHWQRFWKTRKQFGIGDPYFFETPQEMTARLWADPEWAVRRRTAATIALLRRYNEEDEKQIRAALDWMEANRGEEG